MAQATESWSARVDRAVGQIRERSTLEPKVGLILGSGLDALVAELRDSQTLAYTTLPHFPSPTAAGHTGRLVLGSYGETPLAVLAGRVHCYEGYSPVEVAFPTRVLAALGCRVLIVTNSAGGLRDGYRPGDLMAIRDHLSLPAIAGWSPLVGPEEGTTTRFVDLSDAYDRALIDCADAVGRRLRLRLQRGVYAWVIGPQYETPAEVHFLRSIGADAVGMSTVPEVLVARQAGMRVLGLSCITNVLGNHAAPLRHEDVLAQAALAAPRLAELIKGVLTEIDT